MSNIKTIMESWRRYKKSLLKEQDMSSYEPAMSLPQEEEDEPMMSLPPEEPPMDASTTPMTDIAMAADGGPTVDAANLGSSFGEIPTQAEFDDANSSTPVTSAAMRKTGGPTIDAADAGSAAGEIPTQAEFDKSQKSRRRLQAKARKQRRFFKNLAPIKDMLRKAGFPAGSGPGYTAAFSNAVYRLQRKVFPLRPSEHDAIVGPKTFKALKDFGSSARRRKYLKPDTDEKGRTLDDDGKPIDIFDLNEAKKKSPHNDIKLISESWSKFLTEETTKEEEEAGMSLPMTGQTSATPDPNAPNMSMPKPTIMDKVKTMGKQAVQDFNTPMSGTKTQQDIADKMPFGKAAAEMYGKAKVAAHDAGLAGPKADPQPPKPGPKPKPKPKPKGLTGWRRAKATQLRVLRKTFKNKQSVASVQQALVKAGKKYENILSGNGKGKAVDNDYGRRTYNAIAAFQKDYIAKNGKGSLGNTGVGGVDGVVGGRTLEALVKAAPKTKLAKAHTSEPGGVTVKGKESDIKAADKLAKAKGKKAKTAASIEAAKESDAIEKAADASVVRQGKAAKNIFKKNGLRYPEIPGQPGAARTADIEAAADKAVEAGKMSKEDRKELDKVIDGAGKAEALAKQQRGNRKIAFTKAIKDQLGGLLTKPSPEAIKTGMKRRYDRLIIPTDGLVDTFSRPRKGKTFDDLVTAAMEYIKTGKHPIFSKKKSKKRAFNPKRWANMFYKEMKGAGSGKAPLYMNAFLRGIYSQGFYKDTGLSYIQAVAKAYGTRDGETFLQWAEGERRLRPFMDELRNAL